MTLDKVPSNVNESLEDKLEKTPITLLPLKSTYTVDELREIVPEGKIIVCDFYVKGIEEGEEIEFGYTKEGIVNIDHHAPGEFMARQISSANLAIKFVEENGPAHPEDTVIVHHTDCDSVLSSSIVRGILSPDKKYGEAAIAADHTGASNKIADLLQSLEEKRDLFFSLSNLDKLNKGEPLDTDAEMLLNKRYQNRIKAAELIKEGKFEKVGNVYFTSVDERFDAGMLPALLPEAEIIVIGSPMKDNPEMWGISVRLGLAAPEGWTLDDFKLPDFGGRWNAGNTRRHGGTKYNAKEYATIINEQISDLQSG
ncbi:hypothetical protein H0W91_02005 [Patescibacteria group bacterium]|nr:hypothetical protein [Patescibacteria group bacterium]